MADNTTKKFALGTILAAAAGYVAGLLTAPKSGKDTRGDIKETAGKTVSSAEKQLARANSQLEELLDKAKKQAAELEGRAKDQLSAAADKASVAREKSKEILAAIQKGEPDDEDLKKAVAETTKAIDSLKTYLKKA